MRKYPGLPIDAKNRSSFDNLPLLDSQDNLRSSIFDEAYKAYTGNAFGATAVYCGLVLESVLYERTKGVLPANWSVEQLLDTAVSENVISDSNPGPNQISQKESARHMSSQ